MSVPTDPNSALSSLCLSKAMADQLTTVAKERLTTQLGSVNKSDLKTLESVIKLQLGLPG